MLVSLLGMVVGLLSVMRGLCMMMRSLLVVMSSLGMMMLRFFGASILVMVMSLLRVVRSLVVVMDGLLMVVAGLLMMMHRLVMVVHRRLMMASLSRSRGLLGKCRARHRNATGCKCAGNGKRRKGLPDHTNVLLIKTIQIDPMANLDLAGSCKLISHRFRKLIGFCNAWSK